MLFRSGALVPAAIMSVASANLFTRNIYRQYFRPNCSEREEASTAKWVSLVVKFGALLFVLKLPTQYAINLQLLGGIWILQIFPAMVIGLFTRWFHRTALLIGWLAGMVTGTGMVLSLHLKSSVYPLHLFGAVLPAYAALYALIVNLAVTVVLTVVFNAVGMAAGQDQTVALDYEA